MRLSKARVEPLPETEWTPEVREILPRGLGREGRVLNIFRTLAAHPKLLKRWLVFGTHVLYKSTLPARERELVILRTGWLCRSEYEWGQHVIIAQGRGLTDEEIARVKAGPDAAGLERCSIARCCGRPTSCTAMRSSAMRRGRRSRALDTQQLIDLSSRSGSTTSFRWR